MECSTPPRSYKNSTSVTPLTVESDSPTSLSSSSPNSGKIASSRVVSLLSSNSVGSLWTVELASLRQSGSYFEAVECLRRLRILLAEVDESDRVKYCKADYDTTIKSLRKRKQVWSNDLFKEVISITVQFFSSNHFQKLPVSTFIEILNMIPVEELPPLLVVCEEWYDMCTCNEAWASFYHRKFLLNNPGRIPTQFPNIMTAYRSRLMDPQVGDQVEVAWRGKFRLETSDVYQGLAWWVAEVVDKHPAEDRYKIRYPGWDSRWDEWVPRARLRWKVYRNTLVSIQVGDVVELWCCGANVPGAWLESKVKRLRNCRYSLGRVIANGFLWVERDRIRLVRRPASSTEEGGDSVRLLDSQRSRLSTVFSSVGRRVYSMRSVLFPGPAAAGEIEEDAVTEVDHNASSSCSIM
eukprot:gene21616-24511_t